MGPTEVCGLEGGDFATSRACQRREGPRWLDQEPLLCAWLFQKRTLSLEAGLCGISAKGKKASYNCERKVLHWTKQQRNCNVSVTNEDAEQSIVCDPSNCPYLANSQQVLNELVL